MHGYPDCPSSRAVTNSLRCRLQQVRRLVQQLIRDVKTGQKNVRSITVTGHSLGGALAVLCADDIGRQLQAQDRLDRAAHRCSVLLKRVRDLADVDSTAQEAAEVMRQSLQFARKVSTDITASRTIATTAAQKAQDAVCRLQEALSAEGVGYRAEFQLDAGFPNRQERRIKQLAELLDEAQDLFSTTLQPVGSTATKLRKAAKDVPY